MGVPTTDQAFGILPKNSTFFIIWRVENFELVPIPLEDYGKFYKGDSYIVFSAAEFGQPTGVNEVPHAPRGALEIHIHFWLGSETSTDEAGVAAIKTIELDSILGGGPVQHRETEGNESKRFVSYFKKGIRLLKGGIVTGLKKVDPEAFDPALYHIKGKRTTIVKEISVIDWKSMNDGDCYILHTKTFIFVWTGRNSNNMEKIQAAKFANLLRTEHSGGDIVVVEDGQEAALDVAEKSEFQEFLPLNNKNVVPQADSPKDEVVARRMCQEIKLFRCSDESGTLKVTEVKNGPLYQGDLNSNDSYIIDNGSDGVWVWVGKKATQKEREEALRNAQGFVTKKGYPVSTRVSRIIDGGEPSEFRSLFSDWKVKDQSKGFGRQVSTNKIAHTVQTKFDATTLHEQPDLSAKTQLVDDGTGQKEVWRVKDFELIPVPENQYGEFYMGDCYIILYAYLQGNMEHYLLYYWIGVDASQDEAGTAAIKAVELDDKLQGRAIQIRIVQGKEPPQFMSIFSGKIAIYEGGFASSFDGENGQDEARKSSYMLHVRGTTERNTKAIEVDLRAGSLNSNDCFIVVTPSETYVWAGKGSTGDEREVAKAYAGDFTIVCEGSEKADFWAALGGKEEYANSKFLKEEETSHTARLFQCSNASGVFKAEEIVNFSQEDLVDDDVMLLDAWSNVFIWNGHNSNKQEQRAAEEMAFEYLNTDPAGRSVGIPIIKIKQGFEPPNFTGFFGVWDNDLWNNNMTYADICDRLKEVSPGARILVTPSGSGSGSGARTYPIAVLREQDPEKLPEGVDPIRKEDYLCEGDFITVFGCSREEYEKMPKWKRDNKKKAAAIF